MLLVRQFHDFHIHAGSSWTAKTSVASLADAEASRRLSAGKIKDASDHDGA
jgi:hypothetical protein